MSTKNGEIISLIDQRIYDAWTGINASSLKKFMVSPMHYLNWLETKDDEDTNDAFRFGTAFHMAILEPDRFSRDFIVAPDVDRRTKDGKAQWSDFIATLNPAGDNYLTTKEYASLQRMKFNVQENSFWKSISNPADEEYREAGFSCEYAGVDIKGRIDYFNKTKNIIIDWKSINDTPTIRVAKHEIISKGYDIQSFIYQKGVEIVTGVKPQMFFGFVEKKAPFSIAYYELSPERIDSVKELVDVELIRMEGAKTIGIYAGLPSENNPMML
jgi:exodeoxyribonuclease VIII